MLVIQLTLKSKLEAKANTENKMNIEINIFLFFEIMLRGKVLNYKFVDRLIQILRIFILVN